MTGRACPLPATLAQRPVHGFGPCSTRETYILHARTCAEYEVTQVFHLYYTVASTHLLFINLPQLSHGHQCVWMCSRVFRLTNLSIIEI